MARVPACGPIAVLAGALAVVLVAAAPAHGSFPGRNGLLAFGMATENYLGSEDDETVISGQGVGLVGPAGHGRRVVSEDSEPAFSPRGRLLALHGFHGIVIRRVDGRKVARITRGNDALPTWAPSGRRIAFSRVLKQPSNSYGYCAWDGSQEIGPYPQPCPAKLYSVERDGSGLQLLAERGWSPSWSSRGELAYVGPENGVWVSDRHGRGAHLVARFGVDPDWSPAGDRIVFAHPNGLSVVGRDGGGLRQVHASRLQLHSPAWSPDGDRIAFVRNGDGRHRGLYTISLARSSRPVRVTSTWCPPCDEEDDPPTLYGVSWQALPR